jgi:hypothetical protein
MHAMKEVLRAFMMGFYVFIPALYLGYLICRGSKETESLMLLPWFIGGLGSISCLAVIGASRNHLLTFYFIGSLICIYGISKAVAGEIVFRKILQCSIPLSIILFLACVLSASYLAFPNRFGRITVPVFPGTSPSQRHLYLSAPQPKFIENSFDALPWNSGQIPSEAISTYFYFSLVKRGMLKETIESRAKLGYYASAFVSDPRFVNAFESNNYLLVSLLPNGVYYFRQAAEVKYTKE